MRGGSVGGSVEGRVKGVNDWIVSTTALTMINSKMIGSVHLHKISISGQCSNEALDDSRIHKKLVKC